MTQSAAKGWADQHEANFETASVSESSCPCPHGEYGKSVEHHLQKMGSPDPAHDLKHSADYVGRCQAGGIDPGMCAAVIYGAVHHHHPPSSHMTEAGEDKATFRWAEVWFEHVSDGALFVSRIEKVDSTIVADLSGHVVTTNATEHDVDKVLAKGGYKERFVKMDSVRRAAEEPVRWWLVVFSQLNGERGEIHVRARTADDALAKAQQDAQIDLSKQVRTIQLKSGARPDLSSQHAYEDFVAVDATGKVIGTPHKEYFRAKQEAGQTGFVKYVSPTTLEANDSAPACQPFTRVERDPAKFNACMLRAKEVGPIQGSRKIYDLVHADIEKLDEEHFLVLCLDFRGAVRDYVEITIGQRHRVATEVEDILRPIILSGCDGAVVIHNHPSGDAHPSEADDKLTESIREAMRIACPGIAMIDHVIVGRGQFYSFEDEELHKV